MTAPDPPERDDTDARFAEIVAGWEPAEPDTGPWPDPPVEDEEPVAAAPPPPVPVPVPDEEEHYVPPEPPPIPVLAPRTFCGVLTILLGIVIMVFPDLFSLSGSGPLLLGLIAIAGGIGWLLLGLRPDSSDDDPGDDGAQV